MVYPIGGDSEDGDVVKNNYTKTVKNMNERNDIQILEEHQPEMLGKKKNGDQFYIQTWKRTLGKLLCRMSED